MIIVLVAMASATTPAEVEAAIEARLGPLEAPLSVSEAGRIQLPLTHRYDPVRLAKEHVAEGLDTPERQQKAEVGVGPGGAWRHFLGADPVGTDCWATPATLLALVHLTADWHQHCTANLGQDTARCALMVGDISTDRSIRPDPLGHKDHYRGDCLDLRLWRTDGSRYEAWWNRPDDRPGRGHAYDAATTRAFVAFAAARPEVRDLFFNDPEATGAIAVPGHDDHLHLCLGPAPQRGATPEGG